MGGPPLPRCVVLPLCAKLTHKNTGIHTVVYRHVRTFTNVYGQCFGPFFFDRTDMKTNLYRVVCRVKLDGDVCFFLAPAKPMFLLIRSMFFVLLSFSKFS